MIEEMSINYLREQINKHPSMEPEDVMKWCFQAAFGAEHLLSDKEAAWRYLLAECEALEVTEERTESWDAIGVESGPEPFYENISDDLCRVNLRRWKAAGLPLEWLFAMFAEGAAEAAETAADSGRKAFFALAREAAQLIREGICDFGMGDWERYLGEFPLENPVPVHHSRHYRAIEKPAYRLVMRKHIRLLPLLLKMNQGDRRVDMAAEENCEAVTCIIALDGRSAAGKTTLADMLSRITQAGVVHMDDFFLPVELRTAERLGEPGGNVHYERFLEEVVPNLNKAQAFSYGRFDCGRMAIADKRYVAAGRIRIVEGAYSCHPKLEKFMGLRVFCDVEPEEQLARLQKREGENALQAYRERWIPMEEAYLQAYHVKAKADIVITPAMFTGD